MTDPKQVADALRYPKAQIALNHGVGGMVSQCPACKQLYEVGLEKLGAKEKCRRCGITIRFSDKLEYIP